MTARRCFPGSTTALVLLTTAAPLGLPGQSELQATAVLCCVFFWSLFRPASMPPVVVFLLGVLTDLLGYAPPGVSVLTLLMAHGLALRWRRVLVRMGFLLVWFAFIAVSCGAAAIEWGLTSLLTFHLLPPSAAFFEAALGAGMYPILAVLLTRAHQTLAEPEAA